MRMSDMIKKLANLSIKTKFFLLIVFFFFFPFLFFGILWYSESTTIIKKNAIQDSEQLIKQQNRHLDYYFRNLERSTFPLVTHPLVQDFITLSPDQNFMYYKLSKRIDEELLPEVYGRRDILELNIVSEKGVATSPKAYERFEKYRKEEAPKVLGFKLRGRHKINSTPVITLTRTFLDSKYYNTVGMFIIDLKINKLRSISEETKLGESGFIWIAGPNGIPLYHPNEKSSALYVNNDTQRLFKGKSGSLIKEIDGEKKLITYHQSPVTNLIIVAQVPLKEIIGDLISVRKFTILIGTFLIAIVLLLVGGFSLSLTKSLADLQRVMKHAASGNLNVRASEKRDDEIGKVNKSFNKMVEELKRLVGVEIRQRDSTLKAMQSQINPHFLYNTLELINSHAIIEGKFTISRMATSLADMFRYNISDQQQLVTLHKEVDHVKSYLEIQKERYPSLTIEIALDEKTIKKVQSVRLILQPIIENAFEHGYENNKLKPEYLSIRGQLAQDSYCILISDKGKGMPKAIKENYQKAFSEPDQMFPIEHEQKFKRIGLWNVHSRIRLTFGADYGLSILKSDSTGTTIQIKLPLVNNKEG